MNHKIRGYNNKVQIQKDCSKKSIEFVDFAKKHIKVSPFAGEPLGWIIENVGPNMLVYASDYPHPEGTSDPIRKFEATMTNCDQETMNAFYHGNMEELMGIKI